MNVQTLPPGYKVAPWTPPEKIDGKALADASAKLIDLLRIRTQPIGMRLFEISKLAASPGRVLTNRQLLRAVWGPGFEQESHYLRVYIGQLRRKIEIDPARPAHLITEPGVGYRLL